MSTRIKGKKWSPLFCEYVNGHFSVQNNTCAFTYSTVEYAKKKKIIDDDDDGTVTNISSHFTAIYGQFNDRHLIYTYRRRLY